MKCPGQDSRYWKPDSIFEAKCPECGKTVEFFKDDTTRKCGHCGHRFANPEMDFGCAAYCKFADQCLGTLPSELLAQRDDLLKDRIAIEMKKYFKRWRTPASWAAWVARYAEQIGREEQGNLAVILSAAYLNDIGIIEAEKKHNSTAAEYQEQEGPPIAREIMVKLGAPVEIIDEICDIIGHHHHPGETETINFKCLYDADLIANLEEARKEEKVGKNETAHAIETAFLTESGRKLAETTLSN